MKKIRKYYVCGIAWNQEFENAPITLYKSIVELKKAYPCWESCGIVEISFGAKVVLKPTLTRRTKRK